jgi:exportin-1
MEPDSPIMHLQSIAHQALFCGAIVTVYMWSQILEETIKTRWNVLPEDQQKGIRQFLSNVIISVATSSDYAKHRVYLHKLNLVLVQVRTLCSFHRLLPA